MRRIFLTMIIAIVAALGVFSTHAAASTTQTVMTESIDEEALSPVMTTHCVAAISVAFDLTNATDEALSPVMTTHNVVATFSVASDVKYLHTSILTSGNDGTVVLGEHFVGTTQSASSTYDDAMAKIGAKEHGVHSPVSALDGSGRYHLKYPLLEHLELDTAY